MMDDIQRESADTSSLAYPKNKVVGVIDDPNELETTLSDLQALGVAVDEVGMLCGQAGVDQLDRSGKRHGVIAQIVRLVQFLGEEQVHLQRHEEELKAGRFILGIDVGENQELKQEVARVLHKHGGHYVHYFGRYAVEDLYA